MGLAVLFLAISAAVIFPEAFIVSYPLIGSEWTFPLTLLLPVVMMTATVFVWRHRQQLGFYKTDGAVLLFAAFLLARNVWESPGSVSKYVIYGLAIYYLTAVLAKDKRDQRRIFIYVSVLLVVTAIYGLFEFVVQENPLFNYPAGHISFGQPPDATHRVGSFLTHPVVYGAFLVQALPFSIFLWIRGWNKRVAVFGIVTSLLAVVCLFLTQSKGSWIAAFLIGIIAAAYFVRTRGKKSVTVALVLLLVAGLAVGIISSWESLDNAIRLESSVNVRARAWEAAIDGIKENWLVGVGHKQGNQEVIDQIPEIWRRLSGYHTPPTDNNYLNVFLETGLVGGFIWLVMMTLIIVGGFRLVRQNLDSRYMLVAAYLSLIGLMLNMVTFDAMLIPANRIIFWVAAGVLRAQYGSMVKEDAARDISRENNAQAIVN